MSPLITRLRKSECGAAAVEFALVGMIAIVLFLAIIEFGRGLYMRNEMSFAADLAARQILVNAAVANTEVETLLRDAITFGSSTDLQIAFGTESIDGVSYRTLLIRYPVSLFIPGLTNGSFTLSVDRRIPLS